MRYVCVIGILSLPGLFAFSPDNLFWVLSFAAFASALFLIIHAIAGFMFDRINGE